MIDDSQHNVFLKALNEFNDLRYDLNLIPEKSAVDEGSGSSSQFFKGTTRDFELLRFRGEVVCIKITVYNERGELQARSSFYR
jgi:hypothetical protein